MNVLGVDPSLTATGIATIHRTTFTSKGGKGDARLVRLYRDMVEVAADADLAVIEDLPKQAMGAGLTGRAQGVVRLALTKLQVPYVTISAASLKKFATNNGKADKDEMADAAEDVGFCVVGMDDNQVDAWWLQRAGLYRLGLWDDGKPWRSAALNGITKKKGKPDKPVIDWSPWEAHISF